MNKTSCVIITGLLFVINICGNTGFCQDFVTINNNEIHYELKGSGEPWIIMVTGSGLDMSSLDPIFEDLSKETTVLRYSRAGLGNSTFDNKGKDFDDLVDELRLLIDEFGISEPFILGGHSFGGLITKAFAKKYPSRVAGLLSMDPAFEENYEVLEPLDPNIRTSMENPLKYFLETYPDRAATHEFASIVKVYYSPERWDEWFSYPSTIPHFVITSLKTDTRPNAPGRWSEELMQARAEAQQRVITRSNINMQVRVDDAGHEIYDDQPQLVVDSFKMLLNLVKAGNQQ